MVLMISVMKRRFSQALKADLQFEVIELVKNQFLFTKAKTTDGLLNSM